VVRCEDREEKIEKEEPGMGRQGKRFRDRERGEHDGEKNESHEEKV
jgi:hypothetical protein